MTDAAYLITKYIRNAALHDEKHDIEVKLHNSTLTAVLGYSVRLGFERIAFPYVSMVS